MHCWRTSGRVDQFMVRIQRARTPPGANRSPLWTVPEQLTDYQQGAAVDVDQVEQPTRDVLLAKIAFLTGPSPIS